MKLRLIITTTTTRAKSSVWKRETDMLLVLVMLLKSLGVLIGRRHIAETYLLNPPGNEVVIRSFAH